MPALTCHGAWRPRAPRARRPTPRRRAPPAAAAAAPTATCTTCCASSHAATAATAVTATTAGAASPTHHRTPPFVVTYTITWYFALLYLTHIASSLTLYFQFYFESLEFPERGPTVHFIEFGTIVYGDDCPLGSYSGLSPKLELYYLELYVVCSIGQTLPGPPSLYNEVLISLFRHLWLKL